MAIFRLVSVRSCFCIFVCLRHIVFGKLSSSTCFFVQLQDFTFTLYFIWFCYKQELLYFVCVRVYLIARALLYFKNDRVAKIVLDFDRALFYYFLLVLVTLIFTPALFDNLQRSLFYSILSCDLLGPWPFKLFTFSRSTLSVCFVSCLLPLLLFTLVRLLVFLPFAFLFLR